MEIFARIDRLETFVQRVDASVGQMEARVKAMNRAYRKNAVTRMLSSILAMSRSG